jgi:lauroyl/myristoyl acyltransferase
LTVLLGSLAATLDPRGWRVALSNLRGAFGDEISAEGRAPIVRESYQQFCSQLSLMRLFLMAAGIYLNARLASPCIPERFTINI